MRTISVVALLVVLAVGCGRDRLGGGTTKQDLSTVEPTAAEAKADQVAVRRSGYVVAQVARWLERRRRGLLGGASRLQLRSTSRSWSSQLAVGDVVPANAEATFSLQDRFEPGDRAHPPRFDSPVWNEPIPTSSPSSSSRSSAGPV